MIQEQQRSCKKLRGDLVKEEGDAYPDPQEIRKSLSFSFFTTEFPRLASNL